METSHKLRRYACKSPYTKHIISPRNQGICMRFTLSAGLIVQLLLFKSNMCLRTTYLTNFLDLIWQGWSRLFQWISRKTTSRFQNSQYVLGHLSNYNHCETGDFFCEKHMTHDRFQHMRLLHHSIPSIGKCNPASIPSRWCRWYTMQIAPNVPNWTFQHKMSLAHPLALPISKRIIVCFGTIILKRISSFRNLRLFLVDWGSGWRRCLRGRFRWWGPVVNGRSRVVQRSHLFVEGLHHKGRLLFERTVIGKQRGTAQQENLFNLLDKMHVNWLSHETRYYEWSP